MRKHAFEAIVDIRKTLVGKVVATATATALALSMGAMHAFADPVPATDAYGTAAVVEDVPVAPSPTDPVASEAVIAFDTFEAFAVVNGQPVLESLVVPAQRDFTFSVEANPGYAVSRISAQTVDGQGVSVFVSGEHTYVIQGSDVHGAIIVFVETQVNPYEPAPQPTDPSNPGDNSQVTDPDPTDVDPVDPTDPAAPSDPDDPANPDDTSIYDLPITITCGHATKTYDGTPLTADAAMVEIAGFPLGYTVDVELAGSQTEVGQSETSVASFSIFDENGVDVTSLFNNITSYPGTLIVEEYAGEVNVTTVGGTYTYDAAAHQARVTISGLPRGYTVERAESSVRLTNVTSGPVSVTCDSLVIRNAQGEDVTERLNLHYVDGYITINPLRIVVNTPSGAKAYDGTPLTATEFGDDTPSIQAIDYNTGAPINPSWLPAIASLEYTGEQTDVGSSYNSFDIVLVGPGEPSSHVMFSEVIGSLDLIQDPQLPVREAESFITFIGVDEETIENYDIVGQYGVLSVTPNDGSVHIIAPSASKTYDGTPLTPKRVEVAGLPDGFTVSAEVGGTQKDVGSSATTISDYSIFNADGDDVTSTFSNVVTTDGTLTVSPANLVINTPSASKGFDGTPLTATSDTWINGLVAGETADFRITGSQTDVGASRNTYEIVWNGTARQDNYTISEHLGTLRVSPRITAMTSYSPLGTNGDTGVLSGVGGTIILSGPGANAGTAPAGDAGASAPAQDAGAATAPAGSAPVSNDAASAPAVSAPDASATVPAGPDTVVTIVTVPASEGSGYAGSTASRFDTAASGGTSGSAAGNTAGTSGSSSSASDTSQINPVVSAIATGMQNAAQIVTGEQPTALYTPDAASPSEEVLDDDGTPLGAFDEPTKSWVRLYQVVGILLTLLAGLFMVMRRWSNISTMKKLESATLGTDQAADATPEASTTAKIGAKEA